MKEKSHFALVLPGAVARGAYEAGVIEVLSEQKIQIDRIVATSSGALNGLSYAVGIRSGRETKMAKKLIDSWIAKGGWHESLNISFWSLLRGKGLSNKDSLIKLMREMIQPCTSQNKKDVELRIIVTPLNGVTSKIGKNSATTFEHVISFTGEQFDTQKGLDEVFEVVGAACAFPGLFSPVELPGLGACVDGGAVNNAPIKYALEESGVNRVMMPVPFPAMMPPGEFKSGFGLLNHLIEILINERLFRDLQNAQSVNKEADRLKTLVAQGKLSQDQLEIIQNELSIRNVEITEIRPQTAQKSSAFSGFFNKGDRVQLVKEGQEAARLALQKIPAHNPKGKQTT